MPGERGADAAGPDRPDRDGHAGRVEEGAGGPGAVRITALLHCTELHCTALSRGEDSLRRRVEEEGREVKGDCSTVLY